MKRSSLLCASLLVVLSLPSGLWSYGGNVPAGLPSTFGIGTIDKNDNWGGDSTAPHRWKLTPSLQPCFDYSYQYLTNGWRSWSSPDGQWPVNEMQLWEPNGEFQVFTFYYNNGAASLPTSWFGDLMVLMQKIQANSTKKVIIHFEPDFLGFCVRDKGGAGGAPTATGIVTVGGGTAPSGWPGTGAQAWNATNYPNNLIGWAKAIKDMRDLVAPSKVLIAHHFTHWGVSSGTVGDVFVSPNNQSDVNNVVDQITGFLKTIGGGSTDYMDLFFADPADRDAGWWNAHNGGDNSRWNAENYTASWGTRSWGTVGYVVDRVSTNLGKRGMLWQVPFGNHYYKTLDNSSGHWQDNYAQGILPSTSANGSSGTPGDAISSSSTTAGPGYWANHGMIGVLFGEGYYGSTVPSSGDHVTHIRDYGPGDGTTNGGTFSARGGPGAQGQATSSVADNEGGYIRNAVAKYCTVGKFVLPGSVAPTATRTPCVACTATFTPTLTPAPADCPTTFNGFNLAGLNDNGTVTGTQATLSRNTAYTNGITEGASSLKVVVTTAAAWNDKIFQLTGFTPMVLSSYKRLTVDIYVDPLAMPWSGTSTYHKINLSADGGSPTTYEGPIATADIPLVAGLNQVSFTLDWTTIASGSTLTKLYLILNQDGQQPGTMYIDNMVLHTDAACPPTPTRTPTPFGTSTSTPTPTRTPADCPLVLNDGTSLTSNGTWLPVSGTATLNTNAAYATSGNSIKFTVSGAASFQDKLSNIAGFIPFDWRSYDRITFDLYVDPANLLWTGGSLYNQFQVRVSNGSAGQYEVDPTGATSATLVSGWNHLDFPLSWATTNGNGITELYLVPSVGTPAAGAIYYIDNIVLHSDAVCPPPTATSTVTRTVTRTPTPTISPSATRTITLTQTPSITPSATPSITVPASTSTFSSTLTPTSSRTATRTATPSHTALANTATFTSTATPSATRSATPSNTAVANTATFTSTATRTATPSATRTATPSATPSGTRSSTPTVTDTPTSVPPGSTSTNTPTISATYTASPSATPSATRSSTPVNTATATPSQSPLNTATGTPSRTAGPSATDSPTQTSGPSPTSSRTATGTFTPVNTPSNSPTHTAGPSPTFSSTATPSFTPLNSPSATPTHSSVSTATYTATSTVTPSISPTFTDVPPGSTLTDTPTISPTDTPTLVSTPSFTLTRTVTPSVTATSSNTAMPSATDTPVAPGSTATVTPTATPSAVPPAITGLSPSTASTGSAFTLNVAGSGFVSGAQVYLDGFPVGTVFNSGLSLDASIPSLGVNSYSITVRNPDGQASGTQTLVIIAGPVATATATPVMAVTDGPLEFEDHKAFPNPVMGAFLDRARIAVKMKGSADTMTVKIYSRAMHCIGTLELGPQPVGWSQLPLPPAFAAEAGNGTYFYVVSASRRGAKTVKDAIGRITVLR